VVQSADENIDTSIKDTKEETESNSTSNSGYDDVKQIIVNMYEGDNDLFMNIKITKFIMYFDLYISKMDKSHPAFIIYTTKYVKEMSFTIKTKLSIALKKGIKDGTITIPLSEIEFYEEYILQSVLSILLRVVVKESENKAINMSLVEKHVEVILKYIGSKL
jgi:hypothetical protein